MTENNKMDSQEPRVTEQATNKMLSEMVERARLATDAHCDGLPHEPSKEYSDAYFYRMLTRQAAPEAPALTPQMNDSRKVVIGAAAALAHLQIEDEAEREEMMAHVRRIAAVIPATTTASASERVIGGQRWSKEAEMMESWTAPAPSQEATPMTIGEAFKAVGGWMNGGELGYPTFGSMMALEAYTLKMLRAAMGVQRGESDE